MLYACIAMSHAKDNLKSKVVSINDYNGYCAYLRRRLAAAVMGEALPSLRNNVYLNSNSPLFISVNFFSRRVCKIIVPKLRSQSGCTANLRKEKKRKEPN